MKKSFRWLFTTLLIFAGLFLFAFAIFAISQHKWWYRSVKNTTTVYIYTGTTSFNSDKIDERGICKTVASNTCPNDVFIPTKTTWERSGFIANAANAPSCITLDECCIPSRTPATSTVCYWVTFTQNDGCDSSRSATGIKNCASERDWNGDVFDRDLNRCYTPDWIPFLQGQYVPCTPTETLWCVLPYGTLEYPGYRVHMTCQGWYYDTDPTDAPPSTYPLCLNGSYDWYYSCH